MRATAEEPLPQRWDSREHGWITPVRNQGYVGACWAFAALASTEAHLLKWGQGSYDFSEKKMVNLNGYAS